MQHMEIIDTAIHGLNACGLQPFICLFVNIYFILVLIMFIIVHNMLLLDVIKIRSAVCTFVTQDKNTQFKRRPIPITFFLHKYKYSCHSCGETYARKQD